MARVASNASCGRWRPCGMAKRERPWYLCAMTICATLTDLAEWVRRTLQSAIHLDAGLLACLESTFGLPGPEVLLADPHASEAASFLELLFSPDLHVRQDYESQWGHLCFAQEDLRALLEALERPPVMATLHAAHGSEPLRLEVPADALAAFVQRLNMTWRRPPELDRALETRLDDPHRSRVRSTLRHSRVAWQSHRVQLIDLFLSKMSPTAYGFESDLSFLCTLIGELVPGQGPFDFLLGKKLFYFQALCKAEDFERRLRAGNMETVMLQGGRAAYGDIHQWRASMRQVDQVCIALFGRTHYFQQPLEAVVAPDESAPGESPSVATLLRLLG